MTLLAKKRNKLKPKPSLKSWLLTQVIFLNEDEALALMSSETSEPETFKALCQQLGQHCEVTATMPERMMTP